MATHTGLSIYYVRVKLLKLMLLYFDMTITRNRIRIEYTKCNTFVRESYHESAFGI